VPLVSVTEPVAIGAPVPPLTFTVTDNAWVTAMLVEVGVTVTVGVAFDTVTVEEVPVALL
jgi:hypothetical protein